MIRRYRKEIIFYAVTLCFIAVVFTGFLNDQSYRYLNEILNYSLINLGLASSLKILTATFDQFKGFDSITGQIFQLSFFISSLISLQMFLIRLTGLWIFKIAIALTAGLSLISAIRNRMLKILLLLFFLNPGLPVYIQLMKLAADQASLETGKGIEVKFEAFKNSLSSEDESDVTPDPGIREKISLLIKSIQEKGISKTVTDSIRELLEKTAAGLGLLLDVMIRYFISIVILFLIIPVIYLLFLYGMIRKLLNDILDWKIFEKQIPLDPVKENKP